MELTPAKKKLDTVRALLDRAKPQIAAALPRHLDPERMVRVVLTCLLRTPKLLDCDALSLVGAVIQSAQLGLEPDPTLGEAYLVPRWNKKRNVSEVNFMVGYKGLVKLAYQAAIVSSIEARIVHAKDDFKYRHGTDPFLHHVGSGADDPGPMTHAYCLLRFKDGTDPKFEVMPRREIERHRARSSSADDGPWVTDYDAMACKTACRVTMKLAPLSTELRRAIALDERAEAGVPQDLDALVDHSVAMVPSAPAAPEARPVSTPPAPVSATPDQKQLNALAERMRASSPGAPANGDGAAAAAAK